MSASFIRDPAQRQVRLSIVAAIVGTTVEFYNLALFNQANGPYLGPLLFPQADPFTATLTVFGIYLAGFAVRPLGAVVFGHLGDRVGRRTALVVTLSMTGAASALMGLVPTYAQAGILGGVLLLLLRMIQGLGAGGQWAGSVLFALEWNRADRRRGLLASWSQLGVALGLALGYAALQASIMVFGEHSYWAWRVPFLLSAVLMIVGLYIRLGNLETPVFTRLLEERKIERFPVRQVLRQCWREVTLCFLLRAGEATSGAVFQIVIVTYATTVLRLGGPMVLGYTEAATVLSVGTVLLFGYLSDVIGIKLMYMIGAGAMLLFCLPYWAMVDTGEPALVFTAILLSSPIRDMQFAPQAALIAQSFTSRIRYSGASIGFQLGSLWRGVGPTVALFLLGSFHSSLPIAAFMMVATLVGLVSAGLLRDRSRQDLSVEYDDPTPGLVPAS